jgi:hypothetical protein
VVPGGRFWRLDKCGVPSGGVAGSPAAACTGAGAGGGGGGSAGSASAVGALKVSAATIPSAPDITVSVFASISILTNSPSGYRLEAVLLGASAWLAKLLHLWLS